MGGIGSGGHNRLSAAEHVVRGTFRPDRHGARAGDVANVPLSRAGRRRALAGLAGIARHLAGELLDAYGPWDAASIMTLRQYAQAAARLEAGISDDAERRREQRAMLALLAALRLEK